MTITLRRVGPDLKKTKNWENEITNVKSNRASLYRGQSVDTNSFSDGFRFHLLYLALVTWGIQPFSDWRKGW